MQWVTSLADVTFADVPIGARFVDCEGIECTKLTEKTAVSVFCARGFCECWDPSEPVRGYWA